MLLYAKLLILLIVANGAPVLAWRVLGRHFSHPVDFGIVLSDGKPVLGESKTWRGLFFALLMTGLVSPLIGFDWQFGITFAAAAMAGDLVSSFTKRRLGLQSSSMSLGLDQIPESLFPLLFAGFYLSLAGWEIMMLVALFFVSELLLSRILYRLKIRKRPY